MPNIVNELILEEYRKTLTKAPCLIVVHSDKISGIEANNLRIKLDEQNIEWHVVRSRLARMVLDEAGRGGLGEFLDGQSGFFISEDPVQSAQAAVAAEKELKGKIEVGGGWVEDMPMTEAKIRELASLPPRPVLEAMVVNAVKAPISGLVRALAGLARNLVVVMKKISDKKEEESPGDSVPAESNPAESAENVQPEASESNEVEAAEGPQSEGGEQAGEPDEEAAGTSDSYTQTTEEKPAEE